MSKQNKFLLFFFFIFVLFYSSSCFALEIKPANYPHIPLTDPITESSKLPDYIVYFFALGIYLAGALAVISLAIGGIQLIFSSVSPEARNDAIDKIKSAILGLVLLVSSVIIIQTINPSLEEIENKETLKETGGIRLEGSPGKSKAAPMFAGDLDEIKKDYSRINWPKTVNDANGGPIPNCDPKTSGVYLIYWYSEENFKKFGNLKRLKCGETVPFTWAKSYLIVKEVPGVYFYTAPGCTEIVGRNVFPIPHTQSLPQYDPGKIGSIRIVNGPDLKKGPFFGLVWFDGPDYKTTEGGWSGGAGKSRFEHFSFSTDLPASENYSRCISDDSNFGPTKSAQTGPFSWIIYKWAGFNEDKTPNINCSVDLYSRSSWTGGSYTLFPNSGQQDWNGPLENVPVNYRQNTTIPPEEREQCSMFTPKYRCLQSFEIKGNCLVLVSSKKIEENTWTGGTNNYAQAFPISSRIVWSYENRPEGYSIERGTPELENDYITSAYSYFMEIIPLAEPIKN